ncbi:MAG: hypothetical protein Ta2A_07130 [Treponemataceae bacterium]|nr:MAG: hypothetical protein Ta2A_07130 [Treponemataceae bacterium]
MNHKNGFNPLSRTAAHQRAMSRNMVTSLFKHERIVTTKSKALEVRKDAEKLITRAKVDTVHNRRQAGRFISDKTILAKLFMNIGPRMKERAGGYTRILKLGTRAGDGAQTVIFELVDYKLPENTDNSAEKAPKTEAKPKAPTGEKSKAPAEAKPKDEAKSKTPAGAKSETVPKAKVAESKESAAKAETAKASAGAAKTETAEASAASATAETDAAQAGAAKIEAGE